MRQTGMQWEEQQFLFQPICSTKAGESLRASGTISYTCLREQFKKKLKQLGYNPAEFGLHSLRAGGATAAANAAVPERNFKRHGRWKSEGAKDGYVEDSLESRAKVSRQLGL